MCHLLSRKNTIKLSLVFEHFQSLGKETKVSKIFDMHNTGSEQAAHICAECHTSGYKLIQNELQTYGRHRQMLELFSMYLTEFNLKHSSKGHPCDPTQVKDSHNVLKRPRDVHLWHSHTEWLVEPFCHIMNRVWREAHSWTLVNNDWCGVYRLPRLLHGLLQYSCVGWRDKRLHLSS